MRRPSTFAAGITLAVGIALPALAGAQFGPAIHITFQALTHVTGVQIADVEGDGDLDVFVSGFVGTGGVFLHINGGDGETFTRRQILAGALVSEMVVHDLDGDGDKDLLYSNTSMEVGWIEDLGAGGYAAPVLLASVPFGSPRQPCIDVSDLDGDGDPDVVYAIANGVQGSLGWCRNLGQGNFSSAIQLPLAMNGMRQLIVNDMDADGDPDLVTIGGVSIQQTLSGRASWYRNHGNGTFASPTTLENFANEFPSAIQVMDLDFDGDPDLLVSTLPQTDLFYYENSGGVFSARQALIQGAGAGQMEVADMDGNGVMDLVWRGEPAQGAIFWAAHTGPFQFGPTHPPSGPADAWDFDMGDMDGDGLPDAVGSWLTNFVVLGGISRNMGGVLGARREITAPAIDVDEVRAADVDGDGDSDLLTRSRFGAFAWHENIDGGLLGPQRAINSPPQSSALFGLATADLDGDGRADALASDLSTAQVIWYRSHPAGGFDPGVAVATASVNHPLLHADDLDSDGDPDLLYGSGDGDLVAREQMPGGQFGPEIVLDTTATGLAVIRTADIDGDGDMDVLTSAWSTQAIDSRSAWYPNLGGFTFGPAVVLGTGAGGYDVVGADLDGDGRLDVLDASTFSDDVGWYRGLGAGQFQPRAVLASHPFEPTALSVEDFDGDGDLDVAFATRYREYVAVLRQLTPGTFAAPQIVVDETGALRGLVAADFDGDGDKELVSASPTDDRVSLWTNLQELGALTCPGEVNSTGDGAFLSVTGSAAVGANLCVLTAGQLPANRHGYFLTGLVPGLQMPAGSQGNLCLSPFIGRVLGSLQSSGPGGTMRYTLDLTAVPGPNGPISVLVGETRYFQAWYRDVNPNPTSNFSAARSVDFR